MLRYAGHHHDCHPLFFHFVSISHPSHPTKPQRGGSIPNKLSQSEQDLLPEKERRAPPPAPLSNADAYSVRKTVNPVRSDTRFAPLGIQLATKPGGSQRPTPVALPPVQGKGRGEEETGDDVINYKHHRRGQSIRQQ